MRNSFIYISILITIALFNITACKKESDSKSQNINIACNLPLTGDVAIYGVSVRDGITFALEEIEKKGLLNSVNLKFDFQDNKSSNTEAVTILNKQVLSHPQLYISGLDHQTRAIIDRITKSGIPHFTYSWEPFICNRGKNNFRTGINLEQESDYYIKFINHKKPNKLFILHINDPGSFLQFDSIVIPKAKHLGVPDIKTEVFDFEVNDFKTLALKIKSYKPDAIIVAGYDIHLIPLIKDFRNYGLIQNDNLMCSVDLLDASVNLAPELLNDIRFTCPKFIYQSTSNDSLWKEKFKQRFNRPARYGDAYAYDMTYIIYNSVKRANGDYTSKNLVNLISHTNLDGVTGHLTFNPNRDLTLNLNVCYYKSGRIVMENY